MSLDRVWYENQKTGKYGENLFKTWALQDGFDVEDKTEDESYFELDIDYILKKCNYKVSCEVKSCNRICETGNFIVEKMEDIENNKLGWYYKSKAELFVHVDARNEIIRLFKFENLREFVERMILEDENKFEITTCKLKYFIQSDKSSDYSNRIIKRYNWIINMDKFISWNKKNNYFYKQYDLSDLEVNI
jgi:hypothetical protein